VKIIMKFGLAALLVGLLAVPSIAERKHLGQPKYEDYRDSPKVPKTGETLHGGQETSTSTPESSKVTPAAPSPVPVPYPNEGKVQQQDISIRKTVDKSTPSLK
jgi:hypothetical protein